MIKISDIFASSLLPYTYMQRSATVTVNILCIMKNFLVFFAVLVGRLGEIANSKGSLGEFANSKVNFVSIGKDYMFLPRDRRCTIL
jgi:hypothetical protein